MSLKQWLAAKLPVGKRRKTVLLVCLMSMCILLCGFSWTWAIEFTASTIFPFEDAVDVGLILDFGSVVDLDSLQIYLNEPFIAEQMLIGIQSNMSANVYDSIELPDMTQESLGKRIIRIIFDRLFT